MAKQFRFTVRGFFAFPLDMLRYDTCWPETSADVAEMDASIARDDPRKEREVKLCGPAAPTKARWASFGWRVV